MYNNYFYSHHNCTSSTKNPELSFIYILEELRDLMAHKRREGNKYHH